MAHELLDAIYADDVDAVVTLLNRYPMTVEGYARGRLVGLQIAIEKKKVAIITAFLSSGMSAEVRDDDESTPLMWAAGAGDVDTVHRLLTMGSNLEHVDYKGETALFFAVRSGVPDTASLHSAWRVGPRSVSASHGPNRR